MADPIVYIPSFLASELQSGDDPLLIRDRLRQKNWLTDELVEEIIALYPKSEDVDPTTGARDQTKFADNCNKLFPKDRVFASEKQIDQVAAMFLEAWAVVKSHNGKKIICHYGLNTKKSRDSPFFPTLPREHATRKSIVQCPFKIAYSHQGIRASLKKPGIFYRAKITTVVTTHTCGMCPVDMRIALSRTGHLEVNIEGMKDILSLLSQKPRVACQILRPMIESYLPQWKGVSAQYVNNFRRRVVLFLMKNPDFRHLTYDQASALSSKKLIAADEMTGLDDPFIQQNFTEMLRKIMSEDSGMWEGLRLMDDLKKNAPGFDYRIKKDSNGLPVGIMYMTAQMRYHARRYGSVLCLDAQKRQFNSSGWPYIAPVVKDNEMKVALAAESIVTEETHEFYIWILKSMVEIEPRFELANVRLVFADQKLTDTILQELGITSTCTLRGDFYHLLNEVWPDHFHSSVYPQLKKFLRAILLSKTTEEWDDAYKGGHKLLEFKPRMISALNCIYSEPEKYAGYFLRGIEGNLYMNGDVSAEQNHSGVFAYLGMGAAYAIAEQMTHLLGRQKNLDKARRQKEDDQYVTASRYSSPYREPIAGSDDVVAKKTFSGYGYSQLWTTTIKRSFYLQMETDENGDNVVWPPKVSAERRTEETSTLVEEGRRCPCERRIAYQIQCEHEYVVDGGIDIYKFNPRWYHRQTYDRLYPDMAVVSYHPNPIDTHMSIQGNVEEACIVNETNHESDDDNDNLDVGDDDNSTDENSTTVDKENVTATTQPTGDYVSFQQVVSRASDLAGTCQYDQQKMRSLLANINQMIDRVRDGKDIHIHFDGNDFDDNNNMNVVPEAMLPRTAVAAFAHQATNIRRKQGRREYFSRTTRRHRKGVNLSQVSNSNDDSHLPPPKSMTRSCTICRQKGHGQGRCPRITMYGVSALEKGNEEVRQTLSQGLSSITRFALHNRQDDDSRRVLTELPALTEIKALVIHSRFLITSNLVNQFTPENICLECTILHGEGTEHPGYTQQLFKIACIAAYIIRSKSNIIVSQLEVATLPEEYVHQHLSQDVTMGYSFGLQDEGTNPFSQMGFGGQNNI
jgi:hypothetical protein